MTDSSLDNDEKMEYLKSDLLQHQQPHPSNRPPSNRQFRSRAFGAEDDDSSNLFMSEPSVSEADSSEQHMRLLSPLGSFTEDEDDHLHGHDYLPPPPPPPARLLAPMAPSSPGNTSLSSWESPHLNHQHRIHLHFSPGGDSLSHSHKADTSVQSHLQNHHQSRAPPYYSSTTSNPPLNIPHDPYLASALIPPSSGQKTPDRSYVHSSNSTSPASEGQRHRIETFLDDLRNSSQGQVQEVMGTNASFESSTYAGLPTAATIDFDGILRKQPKLAPRNPPQQHSRMSSVDTAAVDNTSGSGEGSANGSSRQKDSGRKGNINNADETVVMVLSDDSGDETKPLVWEQANASTDEEKLAELPAPRTIRNGRSFGAGGGRGTNNGGGRGHRRQRSGDAAAATLSTGSKEWKGMELDKIPLPPVPGGHDDDDDEDDEDDHDEKHIKPMNGSNRNGKPRQAEGTNGKMKPGVFSFDQRPAASIRQEINQFSKFALGTGGKEDSAHASRRVPNSNRYRRSSYRARKVAGPMPDSEDSSSSMASWDPPYSQKGRRTASLPASAFSGYLASPDWSMPRSTKHSRKGSHPVQWSPQSHHSAATSSIGMDDYNYRRTGGVQLGVQPRTPMQSPHTPLFRTTSLEFDPASKIQSAQGNDVNAWAHHSTGSIESSFSWLSGEHNTFFPSSEMSPLIGSAVNSYDGNSSQSRIRPYEFESRSEEKSRQGGNFGPFLQGGRRAFNASPLAKIGKRFTKADRRRFLPSSNFDDADQKHPSFICPICKTRQREFFTVTNAPRQFESASGYIAFYFGIYVIASLYIFGLQEGWGKLDCIYFAVITLTTAGLGDFVPTSDGAKVVCSIFIYFGVACIGLLLGSYIAGMLDESSRRAARANRIKSCPNCVRIQNIRDASERRRKQVRRQKKSDRRKKIVTATTATSPGHDAKRMKRQHVHLESFKDRVKDQISSERPDGRPHVEAPKKSNSMELRHSPPPESSKNPLLVVETVLEESPSGYSVPLVQTSRYVSSVNSPSTARILRRQSHSRHNSLDLGGGRETFNVPNRRKYSADLGVPATIEETPSNQNSSINPPPPPPPPPRQWQIDQNDVSQDDDSSASSDTSSAASSEESLDLEEQFDAVKNARYVFLTLREALINSLVIIGTGCFGFYFIEGFSFVDSWYFTTVLLTTVGYGDLVPYTKGGKLFATIYILVAGTILLNNMSMISMIPLELRRRRTEKAVLTQFGETLDDSALRELATGPLIRKLNLANNHALDECTREMFCLAMLVRLGKVTEEDIKLTFAAFKKLDVHDENILNSRSVIAGMIQKRRSRLGSTRVPESVSQASVNSQSYRSQSSYGFSPWGSGVTSKIFMPSSTPASQTSSGEGGIVNTTTPNNFIGSATPFSE